jgi:hypothetical protein
LLNKSIETKIFPSVWIDAKVSAIFKSGDRKIPSNYRTISVLSVVSKLLERAVTNNCQHIWMKIIYSLYNSLVSDAAHQQWTFPLITKILI